MRFSRQEYWSGLPIPPPGNFPNPGIKPTSPVTLELTGRFFTTESPGKPPWIYRMLLKIFTESDSPKLTLFFKITSLKLPMGVTQHALLLQTAAAKVTSVMSDSVWPHRWKPTRLCCPWDSPGKNTGVGCHFLLQCMKVKSESEVAQLCLTLSDPMKWMKPWGFPGKRVLEWGAIAFSSCGKLALLKLDLELKNPTVGRNHSHAESLLFWH